MEPILEVKNLSKSFRDFKAVDDLSFSVIAGQVYGFLGQNGAGKSTTMRMAVGLIQPDQGNIKIKGKDFTQKSRYLLKNVGAIIERPDMYGYLSGWDNLNMFAQLSGANISSSQLHETLYLVGLQGREKDKVRAYSQGMKQRLGIAIALIHQPDLLILDEPTNGLDPQGIVEMRQLIHSLAIDHGKTIMVSSHLLYEIEQVATQMLILHKGKKVVEGKVNDLLDPNDTLFDIRFLEDNNITNEVNESRWKSYFNDVSANQIVAKMNPSLMPELNKWLVEKDIKILEIKSRHSLEAYFISLTNETIN